jgi:hypothetical protein
MWALWRLADHTDRGIPVRAFPNKRAIFRRVNRALATRLEHLGADISCADPARVMRIPGTVNTKAQPDCRLVQFLKVSEQVFTLPEFGGVLGVRSQKVSLTPTANDEKNGANVRAGFERWKKPLRGFVALWEMRKHFVKNERHNALYIYALLLRRNHATETDIRERCGKLARSCKPELRETDIQRCVSSSVRAARSAFRKSISNETIVRKLRITPEERAALPAWFKQPPTKRADRISNRRSIIRQELERAGVFTADRGRWISTRNMSRILFEAYRNRASHLTVGKDYRALYSAHFSDGASRNLADAGSFRGG